jgi:hypothetical protein
MLRDFPFIRLINGAYNLFCSEWLLQKILAVNVGKSNDLVSPPALLALLPCWATCLAQPNWKVSPSALFVPSTSAFVEVDFYKLIRFELSISLIYLWVC